MTLSVDDPHPSSPLATRLSESELRCMAAITPECMRMLLMSCDIDPVTLSVAAQSAARTYDPRFIAPLFQLLKHPVNLVREGAIAGLARYIHHDEGGGIASNLKPLTKKSEPCKSVRRAAEDVLALIPARPRKAQSPQ